MFFGWGSGLLKSPDDEDLFNKYDVDGDQMLSKQEDGLLRAKSLQSQVYP